jgi:hypothetical protein
MQDTDKPVALPPEKLRELAAWYRQFAERAGNPAILESRLRMATDLDQEAEQLIANAT